MKRGDPHVLVELVDEARPRNAVFSRAEEAPQRLHRLRHPADAGLDAGDADPRMSFEQTVGGDHDHEVVDQPVPPHGGHHRLVEVQRRD